MIAILIVAASLLTQVYVFRDLENSESNREVDTLDMYRELARAESAACRWPAESNSSRTADPRGDR